MITQIAAPADSHLPHHAPKHSWRQQALAACRRIPPLWPLKSFVAVNPFLGLSEHPFVEACDRMRRVTAGGMLMPIGYFREKWEFGEILAADLAAALKLAQATFPEPWKTEAQAFSAHGLEQWIDTSSETGDSVPLILTVADALDRERGTQWNLVVIDEIARFCAAYYDAGQSAWRLPWRGQTLFTAWKAEAMLDLGPESLGLKGFRSMVKALPDDPAEAVDCLLVKLGFTTEEVEGFLHRQLMSIRGWAGAVQYQVRERSFQGGEDESLLGLLAIRLSYDAGLLGIPEAAHLQKTWLVSHQLTPKCRRPLLAHILWHAAFEQAWQRRLLKALARPNQSTPSAPSRKAVQAVFCIDVRSEVLRRAMEALSPNVETLGFAGFFGLPLEYLPFGRRHGTSQCPVLLKPAFRIRESRRFATPDAEEKALRNQRLGRRLSHAWNSFKTSAVSCFSFVETAGLAFGPKLLQDGFLQPPAVSKHDHGPILEPSSDGGCGIGSADRLPLALGMLRNMGLTDNFARLVLLCGHGSATVNNPYTAGLDCGACGGHTGEANARVGAAILNDPVVRRELIAHGIHIPADTWFLAGLHNTTTDDVTLYDEDQAPDSHAGDLADFRRILDLAGQAVRRERAPSLGLGDQPEAVRDAQIRQRSRDWAQVRPEWGLAGNAAFIVAPRARTRGINLGGRAFLHDYDAAHDPENRILELIMTAPMVVTNWINLQYYGSTVNNAAFGSGNKVLHNLVGVLGVCLGNGGDLQTGLPLQSVHDGEQWIHEPHRLSVIIEAPRERIAAVIEKHESVRQLVDHGWLHLFAWEDSGRVTWRYLGGLGWERVDL